MARNPMITAGGYRRLRALLDHPDAPAWNYEVGDRLRSDDLPYVESFYAVLRDEPPRFGADPPQNIVEWIKGQRPSVPLFQSNLQEGFDIRRDWAFIPTTCRADITMRLEDIVPLDADLSRLIVYDTSGVTAHAIQIPHHPRAMAQYHPAYRFILEQYGIRPEFSDQVTACLNVGCQVSTVTFANVFSVWNQAGFAKVNLHERVWERAMARRFFSDTAPLFITGDPLGFAQMAKWGIDYRPAAMISTAVALAPELKAALEARYACPVIDLYSTTETGPIAFTDPSGEGMRIFAPDLYVEVVDSDGRPVPEGEVGEICVTGGRNPFLPLLRYRTGDYCRIVSDRHGRPCLRDLQAREPVNFVDSDGLPVCMVDVSRIIRACPLVQHQFIQHADASCSLVIQPLAGYHVDTDLLLGKLAALFGPSLPVSITLDERLADKFPGGKVIPFSSA